MKESKAHNKEKALKKICKERNWNPDNLTPKQKLFIALHKSY